MIIIDNSLRYLLESLSNYEDDDICQHISQKIEHAQYEDEETFVDDLEEDEIVYLDRLLEREINYAKSVQDEVRVRELSEIYELLLH